MNDLKVKSPGLDPAGTPLAGKAPQTTAGGATGGGPAAPFQDTLKQAERARIDGELKEILSTIRTLGERFVRAPDEGKLNTYKDGIRQYLQRISKELFSLRQEPGSTKDGQQKLYQMVETVNHELDSLTRETLQKDRALGLLASLDEIRGLVLDLIT